MFRIDYPESVNLPFNSASIRGLFELRYPHSLITGEPGYWAILQGNNVILDHGGDRPCLPEGELPDYLAPAASLCIGFWQGKPLRVVSVDSDRIVVPPLVAEAFNATGQRADSATLSICGLAKQILYWEQQSRHCSCCGGATERGSSGFGKQCTVCRSRFFPNICPCAIVLVKRGKQLLLVRKAEWVAGRYGLVAGFADFGESLEECAAREVKEETGIGIANIRYVGSQSWPFPSQLMAGFVAEYASGEITVAPDELEDARWFPVDDLPPLPPKMSIARWLIDRFRN